MFRKDYVVRLIEQCAKILAKALFHKDLKQFDAATAELHTVGTKLLGLDWKVVNQMSDTDIIQWLGRGKELDDIGIEKCRWIAEILSTEAEILAQQSRDDESFEKFVKAFSLQMESVRIERTTDWLDKTRRLLREIEDYELPPHIERKRENFYMMMSRSLN
jgi:hypothetical protein